MESSKYNLHELTTLLTIHRQVLETYENRLRKAYSSSDKTSNRLVLFLEAKTDAERASVKELEHQIKELSIKKPRHSVEGLFNSFGVRKSFTVNFLPTSNAFNEYGKSVTGVMVFTDSEMEAVLKGISNKESNDGYIKFNLTANRDISDEIKERLLTKGFLASDVFDVLYI